MHDEENEIPLIDYAKKKYIRDWKILIDSLVLQFTRDIYVFKRRA